ncbi:S26 family signal peptidase [Methylosarcina fibrata]|uniref:S26 family signal peptidase n=1 Tax=Methylosarcina fibrata TaxID=105972 RepID=UPI002FC2C26D
MARRSYRFSGRTHETVFQGRPNHRQDATGVTGDRVQVDSRQTRINGALIIEGLPLAEKLRKPLSVFKRDETIPAAAYWVTGLTPKSFDSRYWGYVYDHQVIGRAYAIF